VVLAEITPALVVGAVQVILVMVATGAVIILQVVMETVEVAEVAPVHKPQEVRWAEVLVFMAKARAG
jgi:hypothetical protein